MFLALDGVWLGEDYKTNVIKAQVNLNRDWATSSNFINNPHSIMNTIRMTHVFSEGINKCALPMLYHNENLGGWSDFCRCFIVDLLMQHKNLLSKSNE